MSNLLSDSHIATIRQGLATTPTDALGRRYASLRLITNKSADQVALVTAHRRELLSRPGNLDPSLLIMDQDVERSLKPRLRRHKAQVHPTADYGVYHLVTTNYSSGAGRRSSTSMTLGQIQRWLDDQDDASEKLTFEES